MMRVFVAGATGAIGRQLVPRLVEAGHEVHGMTRSESKRAMLQELGAVPVVADALDPDQVAQAVGRARPDVIVHQLTALGGGTCVTSSAASCQPTVCGPRGRITCSQLGRRWGCSGSWRRALVRCRTCAPA